MPDIPWIQQNLSSTSFLLTAIVTAEISFVFVCLLLFIFVYQYRKRGADKGLGRFALLLALNFGVVFTTLVGALYQADQWRWLVRGWQPGTAITVLILLVCGLVLWQFLSQENLPEPPQWFDPHI